MPFGYMRIKKLKEFKASVHCIITMKNTYVCTVQYQLVLNSHNTRGNK